MELQWHFDVFCFARSTSLIISYVPGLFSIELIFLWTDLLNLLISEQESSFRAHYCVWKHKGFHSSTLKFVVVLLLSYLVLREPSEAFFSSLESYALANVDILLFTCFSK